MSTYKVLNRSLDFDINIKVFKMFVTSSWPQWWPHLLHSSNRNETLTAIVAAFIHNLPLQRNRDHNLKPS